MIQILEITPFGFVVELLGESCFPRDFSCQVYLNGAYHSSTTHPVIPLFGLAPDTEYRGELRGLGEDIPFEVRTQPAGFVLNVRDYGAAGDGAANDTAAINAALYTAPRGAVVRVPPGDYRVDQVLLRSGVDLYLEEGAVLRQNTDRTSLPILRGYQKDYWHREATINASWEGHPLDCFGSLIYGKGVEGVRLYGAGILDGSGREGGWWRHPKEKRDGGYRPRNLTLVGCRDIAVSGLTSRGSAAWNIHPLYSDNLNFYALEIESCPDSPNTDGLNPESCENVRIVGCRFRVGDDCIAIKSGKYFMATRHLRPCRNIEIRSCLMEEGHGGVVIGSEIACGVKDVRVSHCRFRNTDRGLRIKTRRGRGQHSVVDGVTFSQVEMDRVAHCFVVNMFYNCDPDGHSEYVSAKMPLPVDEMTPAVRNIRIAGVTAREITGTAVFLYGLPERPVEEVTVRDSLFEFSPHRRCECPAMMDDPVEVENLGVFLAGSRDTVFENNQFIGTSINLIDGKEAHL